MASALRHWPRILMRTLRIIAWTLCGLVGIVLIVLGLALSPWGTSWLMSQAQSRGLLSYSAVEGAPLDHLVIHDLHLPLNGTTVDATRLDLEWAKDCLLRGKLCIESVQGDGIRISLAAAEPAPEAATSATLPMARISVPLPVDVRRLALNDVNLFMATGMTLSWASLTSGAALQGSQLTLQETVLSGTRIHLPPATAEAVADATAAATVPTEPLHQLPIANPLAAYSTTPLAQRDTRITLPDIVLPLDITASSVRVDDLEVNGATPIRVDEATMALHTLRDQVTLERFTIDSPDLKAELKANVTLSGDYPLSLHMASTVLRQPISNEQVVLEAKGSLAALAVDIQSRGPVDTTTAIKADLLSQRLPFSFQTGSPRVQWPLPGASTAGASTYVVDDLSLQASGDLDHYRFGLEGRVRADRYAPMPVKWVGEGNDQGLSWAPLSVGVGKGSLKSEGRLTWAPTLNADVQLALDHFQLETLVPSMPSLLNGQARLEFKQHDDRSWQLKVPTLAIDGTLMKQPLSLNGKLDGNSAMQWHIQQLALRQGSNRLDAIGEVDERLALKVTLDAPRLASLWPGLGGRLAGQADIKGTLQAPEGTLTLEGQQLRYATHQLDRLRLKGSGRGSEDPTFDLTLAAQGVRSGTLALRDTVLTAKGRLSQHRLELNVDGQPSSPLASAHLSLDGRFDKQAQRYRARLSPLTLHAPSAGHYRLDTPMLVDVDVAHAQAVIQPFCLRRAEGGQLCATRPVQAGADQGNAQLKLDAFPMEAVNAFMPEPWSVTGATQGNVNVRWSNAGAQWNVDGTLGNGTTVKGKSADGKPFALPALSTEVHVNATPARAQLNAVLQLKDAGRIALDATVKDPLQARTLAGRLNVSGVRFAPYRPLVAGLDLLEGELQGDVGISGSLEKPRLNGTLAIVGVRAKGPIVPLSVDDAKIAINFQGERGVIDGYIASNGARLTLNGQADWPTSGNWKAALSIRNPTAPLEVMALDYGRVRISPSIDIRATPRQLDVEGTVRVPWARIEVAQIPPTVQAPSRDEVILTRKEAERLDALRQPAATKGADQTKQPWANVDALEKAGMALNLNVKVLIGDDVQIAAYGLNSHVVGSLDIRQRHNAIQLFGTVSLQDGKFKAFGQDLLIRKGSVVFSGPASQPRLDVEAIRNPESIEDNVTAGVRVTGNALTPQVQIFSVPAMNETSALSYLLQGHGTDADGNDNALTSALIGLSVAQSGRAVGALGESFGIQDLTLDTAGSGDKSQVVVSGYVFPRLKVSYGVGVFSPIAELTLRYRLLQNLYLQAVSGSAQALDLLYTFSLGRTPDTLPIDEADQQEAPHAK